MMAIAVGITVGTTNMVSEQPGLYVLYAILFLVAIVFNIKGIYYCTIQTSRIV